MEGWHAHFDATQIETALNCFAFGLSDTARLEVHSRGGRDYRWTLEVFEDGVWRPDSTTGLLFFRFWRMKTVRYLRNSMIVSEEISLPVEAESLSIDQTKPTAKAPLTRPSVTLSPQGGRGKNERRERG